MTVRLNLENLYDANSGKSTMPKKFVTPTPFHRHLSTRLMNGCPKSFPPDEWGFKHDPLSTSIRLVPTVSDTFQRIDGEIPDRNRTGLRCCRTFLINCEPILVHHFLQLPLGKRLWPPGPGAVHPRADTIEARRWHGFQF